MYYSPIDQVTKESHLQTALNLKTTKPGLIKAELIIIIMLCPLISLFHLFNKVISCIWKVYAKGKPQKTARSSVITFVWGEKTLCALPSLHGGLASHSFCKQSGPTCVHRNCIYYCQAIIALHCDFMNNSEGVGNLAAAQSQKIPSSQ